MFLRLSTSTGQKVRYQMKIVIDIPEETYNSIEPFLNGETIKGGLNLFKVLEIIKNGTPLDEVRAEIAEEICLTNNPYTKETKYTIEHLKLLEILDHIGKAKMQ